MPKERIRCPWAGNDPDMIAYHDAEWGVPQHNDRKLFEFLILETFQAGLSWRTVLHKRAAFHKAFANFNPRLVAKFDARKVKRLMHDTAIIRNGAKIRAAVNNARCFLAIQKEFGSFDKYVWSFVKDKPIRHRNRSEKDFVARNDLSDRLSEDMGKRGFTFRGSTICYAFLQATGMINDHVVSCFRYRQISKRNPGSCGVRVASMGFLAC